MKRLLFICIATLFAICSMADEEHNARFKKALKDSIPLAKEILAEWEKNGPADGDFYAANCKIHQKQAFNYAIAKSKYMPLYAADSHMIIKDSLGNVDYFMYSGISVVDSTELETSIVWLMDGIAKFPKRLDLRMGLAYTFEMLEDCENLLVVMEDIVNWKLANPDTVWTWNSDKEVSPKESPVEDKLQEYFMNCYNSSSFKGRAEKFADLGLRLVPNNPLFWNDKAGMKIEAGDYKAALEIMETALKNNPGNELISTNIERLKEIMKEK